jgi:4'-phosphopantetheinyl transferase N-terminal domain/4'-phosphopantetheinyl transferase superfamily
VSTSTGSGRPALSLGERGGESGGRGGESGGHGGESGQHGGESGQHGGESGQHGGERLPANAALRWHAAEPILRQLRAVRAALGGLGYGIATRWDRDPAASHPAEYRLAVRMTPQRRSDFLVGRRALRRALADIGMPQTDAPIPIGNRNQPRLGADVTASVSHCRGIAVALARPADGACSVGVDLELGSLPLKAAHLVLTEPERAWLAEGPSAADREYRLLAAFSAKEAVYKALDPILHAGTLRRIHLIPVGSGFVGWPASRRDLRLRVCIHPVGTGVLAWTLLRTPRCRPG